MTVVDSSAIVAILRTEPDAPLYSSAMERQNVLAISAATLVELGVVFLHREGPALVADLYELLEVGKVAIIPVSEAQARMAVQAYERFGKSSQHPARLNFGDCFAYALAKDLNQPLLFKGDDFARTDIRAAL